MKVLKFDSAHHDGWKVTCDSIKDSSVEPIGDILQVAALRVV